MFTLFTACATAPRYQYSRGITRDTKGIPPTQRPYEIFGEAYYPIPSADGFAEEGIASWYGPDFHGKGTSCGEIYDMYEFTAAHKLLPMHTYVRVLNLENNQETVVRINDRGPFVKGRVIDLSLAAAKEIGMHNNGTAFVRIEALGAPTEVSENGQRVKRFVQTMDYRAGKFWIQVGAFTSKDNADRLRDSLNKNYDQVDIEAHNRGDALFYRVQVFASTNLDKARDIQRQFEDNGFHGAFLVAR
ncbi:MAG: septal ring lytic transglycosylase RlpA family protein [Thermodesulfobacteriota bacterium]|nr:septal ring lytic transglycosylase RlpA family protein [Thermodesulfobacteriota bacterium]